MAQFFENDGSNIDDLKNISSVHLHMFLMSNYYIEVQIFY